MLILTRSEGESIMIGEDIEIKLISAKGDKVKIGIKAPKNVIILRKELCQQTEQQNKQAASSNFNAIDTIQTIFDKK